MWIYQFFVVGLFGEVIRAERTALKTDLADAIQWSS